MANTLGLPEVTLAQVSDSTHAINAIDLTGAVSATPRKSVYQPIVVRVTDHAHNDAAEVGTDTDKMAIFESCRHGEPWKKVANNLGHKIWPEDRTTFAPIDTVGGDDDDFNIIYPDFDYSTFE